MEINNGWLKLNVTTKETTTVTGETRVVIEITDGVDEVKVRDNEFETVYGVVRRNVSNALTTLRKGLKLLGVELPTVPEINNKLTFGLEELLSQKNIDLSKESKEIVKAYNSLLEVAQEVIVAMTLNDLGLKRDLKITYKENATITTNNSIYTVTLEEFCKTYRKNRRKIEESLRTLWGIFKYAGVEGLPKIQEIHQKVIFREPTELPTGLNLDISTIKNAYNTLFEKATLATIARATEKTYFAKLFRDPPLY